MKTVLAVDPGSYKCGIAVVTPGRVLHQSVVPRDTATQAVASLVTEHQVEEVIIGNGTGSDQLARDLLSALPDLRIETVEEAYSSRKARERFFEDNPPRGLRRLIPRGLLLPHRPYDDYVAIILAEDYLSRTPQSSG